MTKEEYLDKIQAIAAFIRSRDSRCPQLAVILGSGLGKLGESIENRTVIPYSEIPGFPVSTAIGHKGNLIIGELSGKCVIAMQGRFHYYEGYTMWQVTLPVRVFAELGVKYLFVSNAAGGLNYNYQPGDIMLIRDHINLAPNPLIGPNLEKFGPRFPDMSRTYSPRLIRFAESCAVDLGLKLQKGVFLAVTGPAYETPAECKCFRNMGADAVAMSTVPEVIVARHCGIEVMGISIITNVAQEESSEDFSLDGNEVVAAADAAADRMIALFSAIIRKFDFE